MIIRNIPELLTFRVRFPKGDGVIGAVAVDVKNGSRGVDAPANFGSIGEVVFPPK